MTKNRAKTKKIGEKQPTALDVLESIVIVGRALGVGNNITMPSLAGVVKEPNTCTCTPQDLQPVGECLCTPIAKRREPKIVCCIGCSFPDCYCQK